MAGRPRHNANPNYNGNPYGHLGQPIQNYDLYALPNSTAADQQTLSPAMSHFRGPNPMMSYFEDAGLGSGGGPSNTTPHPRQPQSYMPSEFGVDTGSYNTGGRRYFTPLPNGPIEAPSYRYNENVSPRVRDDLAGAQDAAGSLRQPVTGPVVSESESPLAHDSSPQPRDLLCRWPGCSNTEPFARKGDLDRHIRTLHISPRSYNCEECTRVFNRTDNLAAHKQRCHTNITRDYEGDFDRHEETNEHVP